MDCQTARHLLDLARDCGPDDRADLDAHLDECGACQGFAAGEAGFDAALTLAMRSVPLPAGGLERAVRLATVRRGEVVRGYWLRGVAAVAAVGLAVPVGYTGYLRTRPTVDTTELAQRFDLRRDDPERFAAEWLTAQGLPPTLPHRFDFRHLSNCVLSDLTGRPTPCLQFVRERATLDVYVLRRGQFRLDGLSPAQSSFATVMPVPESADHPGVAYLLVYTSPTLDGFLKADPVQ